MVLTERLYTSLVQLTFHEDCGVGDKIAIIMIFKKKNFLSVHALHVEGRRFLIIESCGNILCLWVDSDYSRMQIRQAGDLTCKIMPETNSDTYRRKCTALNFFYSHSDLAGSRANV